MRPGAASASIVASEDVSLRELKLDELPVADRVRQTVAMNLARVVATRLASTQANVVHRHQEQLTATARAAATSDFVTRTLVALACCMFSLPTIAARESPAGERALFSLAFATLFFGIAWVFVRGNHFEHALLGMKRRDWSNQLRGALPCTLTMMHLAGIPGILIRLLRGGWPRGERISRPPPPSARPRRYTRALYPPF